MTSSGLGKAPARLRPTVPRLIALNGLIRVAAAASGQLFAFLIADRIGARAGAGAFVVGLAGAAFFVTELLGAPWAGRLADRFGQRRVLRYGPLFGIVSSVVATAAVLGGGQTGPLVVILVIARFNEGASAACAVPTTLVLLSRATDGEPKRRLRVMGLFEITSLIGMILGFVLAGVSWDSLGAKAFLLLAPLYFGAWLLIGARHAGEGSPSKAAAPVFDTLLGLARAPGNVAFGISWLAVNAVVGLWIQQAPYLLKLPSRSPTQALVGGYSGREIGLVFGGWGVVFLVGITLWSLLGARWEKRRALALALAGMLGVVATLTFVNHGAPAALVALAALFVLVESGYTPVAFAHLADATVTVDPSRGAALGLYSVLLAAGQLLGNVVGAPFAARWQMDGVLAVTALFTVVALAGVARMPQSAMAEPGHP